MRPCWRRRVRPSANVKTFAATHGVQLIPESERGRDHQRRRRRDDEDDRRPAERAEVPRRVQHHHHAEEERPLEVALVGHDQRDGHEDEDGEQLGRHRRHERSDDEAPDRDRDDEEIERRARVADLCEQNDRDRAPDQEQPLVGSRRRLRPGEVRPQTTPPRHGTDRTAAVPGRPQTLVEPASTHGRSGGSGRRLRLEQGRMPTACPLASTTRGGAGGRAVSPIRDRVSAQMRAWARHGLWSGPTFVVVCRADRAHVGRNRGGRVRLDGDAVSAVFRAGVRTHGQGKDCLASLRLSCWDAASGGVFGRPSAQNHTGPRATTSL